MCGAGFLTKTPKSTSSKRCVKVKNTASRKIPFWLQRVRPSCPWANIRGAQPPLRLLSDDGLIGFFRWHTRPVDAVRCGEAHRAPFSRRRHSDKILKRYGRHPRLGSTPAAEKELVLTTPTGSARAR